MRHLLWFILLLAPLAHAQEQPRFGLPFDFPMLLSANFGELRPNHFHGGLDIKTQGTTGHPVHAVADGYVSRISVSPSAAWQQVDTSLTAHGTSALRFVYHGAGRAEFLQFALHKN